MHQTRHTSRDQARLIGFQFLLLLSFASLLGTQRAAIGGGRAGGEKRRGEEKGGGGGGDGGGGSGCLLGLAGLSVAMVV